LVYQSLVPKILPKLHKLQQVEYKGHIDINFKYPKKGIFPAYVYKEFYLDDPLSKVSGNTKSK